MFLAIDIGNTNIVLGAFADQKILFTERLSTDAKKTAFEYAILLHNVLEIYHLSEAELEGAIISSVVPVLTTMMKNALHKLSCPKTLIVGPGIKTGLNILLDNPAQIGADLVVAAVAGIAQYSCPLILIDMGTATTISVIDKNHSFRGGIIMPGLRVSLESLTSSASALPGISLDPPRHLIGRNTVDSMKSGILYGNASCLDGMIDRVEKEIGEKTTVVATGGLSSLVIPLCCHEIIQDEDLLMKGLMLLYQKNR